ncbi:hypothetical protein BRC89_10795 [Halobacteriales archaeon QS_4_70_19]|nr:MAG: hypothetical protein BRC89_10795 [Halobacteriales archaeon QS_4_70_19]
MDHGGIVFFRSESLDRTVAFYRDLGCSVWREQPDCTILDFEGFRYNDTYGIYQAFARDPEGRTVEMQCFER